MSCLLWVFVMCSMQDAVDRRPIEFKPATEIRERVSTARVYDVADFLDASLVDFEPPQLGTPIEVRPPQEASAEAAEGSELAGSPQPTAEERTRAARALAALVERHVQPRPDASIDRVDAVGPGALLVYGGDEQHAWIQGFLNAQREHRGPIETEARIFVAAREAFAALGVANGSALADERELATLLARVAADARFTELAHQSLVSHPRQRACIAVIDSFPYVADWVLEIVQPSGAEIADPQIRQIHTGVTLDVRAFPVRDGRMLAELQLVHCRIAEPVRTEKVRIGTREPQEVELALPEAEKTTIKSDVELADGATVVLASSPLARDEVLVAFVSVRRAPAGGR